MLNVYLHFPTTSTIIRYTVKLLAETPAQRRYDTEDDETQINNKNVILSITLGKKTHSN